MILGIDPGFAKLGWCLMTANGNRVLDAGIVETKKAQQKGVMYSANDNIQRLRVLLDGVGGAIGKDTRLLCMESASFVRSAKVMHQIGMARGGIVSMAYEHRVPLLEASPRQIKVAVTGKASASKQEIAKALAALHPEMLPLLPRAKSKHEHMWDALGAIKACMRSDVYLMVKSQ